MSSQVYEILPLLAHFMMRDLGFRAVRASAGFTGQEVAELGFEAFQRPLVLDAPREMNDWVWLWVPEGSGRAVMSGQGRGHIVKALGTYHYPKGPLCVNRMV